MTIETARLTLLAAPAGLARALCAGDAGRVAELLGAAVPAGWPDAELAGILPQYLDQILAAPATLGYGVWVAVAREPRTVVGSAGFIAPPDDGTIELGYGIHPDHRNAGYATEAAAALLRWGLGRADVRRVTAECELDNRASIRVLEKIGMRRLDTRGGVIRWTKARGLTSDGASR